MAHRCGKGWPGREVSMSFRDILVFLDGGDASEGRLQLATKIARDHGACLSAVFLQNGQATGLRPRFAAPWLGLVTGHPPPARSLRHRSQKLRTLPSNNFAIASVL